MSMDHVLHTRILKLLGVTAVAALATGGAAGNAPVGYPAAPLESSQNRL